MACKGRLLPGPPRRALLSAPLHPTSEGPVRSDAIQVQTPLWTPRPGARSRPAPARSALRPIACDRPRTKGPLLASGAASASSRLAGLPLGIQGAPKREGRKPSASRGAARSRAPLAFVRRWGQRRDRPTRRGAPGAWLRRRGVASAGGWGFGSMVARGRGGALAMRMGSRGRGGASEMWVEPETGAGPNDRGGALAIRMRSRGRGGASGIEVGQ